MLRWDDDELVGTIFHELAHQLVYVKDDTAFNESYASFVQDEGLREWRAARGESAREDGRREADAGFARLALDLRERLRELYARKLDAAAMEMAKQNQIADFRQRYTAWRDAHFPEDHRYDAFVARPINNASLLPFGLYDGWMPAFAALFAQSGREWPSFHARVRALARMSKPEREARLKEAGARGEKKRVGAR
jgi:predicted aminopeptidase